MQEIGTTHLGEHIGTHAVGTESDQNAFFKHFKNWGDSHRVIHIRFGVVDYDCSSPGYDIHFIFVNMDAMNEMDFLPVAPSLCRRFTMVVLYFLRESSRQKDLPHMNVAANIGIFGNADTFLQGLVGKRKGGVQSHHSCNLTIALANFLDETSIFSIPPPITLRSETS